MDGLQEQSSRHRGDNITMSAAYASVVKRAEGYAVVSLAREPANVMDLGFWQRLTAILDELEQDSDVRGVVFCSGLKRDIFTAGRCCTVH